MHYCGICIFQVLQMAVSHYQDVTEERALGHTCGYPLCDNTIKQVK